MIKVIGVRFRKAGKVYFFDPVGLEIKTGDCVIVETARGIEYGRVVIGSKEVEDDKVIHPLKSVIRVATEEDHAIERRNKENGGKLNEQDTLEEDRQRPYLHRRGRF